MKTLRLKRVNDNQTVPIFLILEDGTKLKYGESELFNRFKEGETFCLEIFGEFKVMTRSFKKVAKPPFQNEEGIWVIVYEDIN